MTDLAYVALTTAAGTIAVAAVLWFLHRAETAADREGQP